MAAAPLNHHQYGIIWLRGTWMQCNTWEDAESTTRERSSQKKQVAVEKAPAGSLRGPPAWECPRRSPGQNGRRGAGPCPASPAGWLRLCNSPCKVSNHRCIHEKLDEKQHCAKGQENYRLTFADRQAGVRESNGLAQEHIEGVLFLGRSPMTMTCLCILARSSGAGDASPSAAGA
jgi:hypothetical protein